MRKIKHLILLFVLLLGMLIPSQAQKKFVPLLPGTVTDVPISVSRLRAAVEIQPAACSDGLSTGSIAFGTTQDRQTYVYTWTINASTSDLAAIGYAGPMTGVNVFPGFTPILASSGFINFDVAITMLATGLPAPDPTGTASIEITKSPEFTSGIPVSGITQCAGGSVSAITFVTDDADAEIHWMASPAIQAGGTPLAGGNETFPGFSATNANAGTYTITVTAAANGICTTTETFTITVNPQPVHNTITGPSVCTGNSTSAITVDNDATNTYLWSITGPGVIPTPTGTTATIPAQTFTTAGTYNASFTSTNSNGCSTTTTFTYTVNPTPTVNTATTPPSQCTGVAFSHTLTGTNATSYNWDFRIGGAPVAGASGTGPLVYFTPTAEGSYTLYATPVNDNCTGTELAILTLQATVPPVMQAPTTGLTGCTGVTTSATDYTTTGAEPGVTYAWTLYEPDGSTSITSGTDQFPGRNFGTAGDYILKVTPTLNNCSGTEAEYTISITQTPTVSAELNGVSVSGTPPVVCEGTDSDALDVINLSGGQTYTWSIYDPTNPLNIPTPTVPTLSGTDATVETQTLNTIPFIGGLALPSKIYMVSVTASNGSCPSATVTFPLVVNKKPVVNITTFAATACSGDTYSFTVTGDAGTTFDWEIVSTATGNHVAASGTGAVITNPLGTVINIPLITGTDVIEDYQIELTNISSGAALCPGADVTSATTVAIAPELDEADIVVENKIYYNGVHVKEYAFSGAPAGVTYEWRAATPADRTNGIAVGIPFGPVGWNVGDIGAFRAVNTTNEPIVVNLQVRMHYTLNGFDCVSDPEFFTITVKPSLIETLDIHTVAIANQTVCAGGDITPIIYIANNPDERQVDLVTFHTKLLYGKNVLGVNIDGDGIWNTGLSGAVMDTPIEVSGTYTVTPVNGNLQGQPSVFTITVKPNLTFVDPADTIVDNGQLIPAFAIESNVQGVTCHWKADDVAGTNLPAEGDGMFPQIIARNTTDVPVTVTYTVTAPGVNCFTGNTSETFTITINPAAKVAVIADTTICSGTAVNIPLTGTNVDHYELVFVSGDKNWGSALAISGDAIVAATGALNNALTGAGLPATTPLSSIYHVIPVNANGVKGEAVPFMITVNPYLDANLVTRSSKVYYNGDMVPEFALTGLIQGADYLWFDQDGSKTEKYIGLNDISGKNTMPAFTAINNTNDPIIATYQVGVHYQGCTSDPAAMKTFTITVMPKVIADNDITIDPVANKSVCAGESVSEIVFTPRHAFDNTLVSNITYKWEFIEGTNVRADAATSGDGNMSAFTAISPDQSTTGTYRVTPRLGNSEGKSIVFSITVNPKATITAITPIVVTSGALVSETHFTSNLMGLKYTWTTANATAAATLNLPVSGEGAFPSFMAVNNTTANVTVVYTVSVEGCNNGTKELSITVKPSPVVNPIADRIICSNEGINIPLTGSNVNNYELKYVSGKDWGTAFKIDAAGTAIEAATDALVNSTLAPMSGLYSVTPVNADGVKGTAVQFVLTVNPALNNAALITNVSNKVYSNGDVVPEFTFAGHLPEATYTWTVTGSTIGLSPLTGKNTMPSFVAINNGTTALTCTVKVQIDYKECSKTDVTSFTITVNPKTVVDQDITVDPIANINVCSDQDISAVQVKGKHAFNSDDVTYKWEFVGGTNVRNDAVTTGSVTGTTGALATIMAQTAPIAVTTQAVTGTYRVTPSQGNSAGNPIFFTITINPKIVLNDITAIDVTGGTIVPETRFSSNVAGLKYTWSTTSTTVANTLNLPSNGETAAFPSFTAINNTTSDLTIRYAVKVEGVCNSDTKNLDITVHPAPRVSAIADSTICAETGKAEITINGNFADSYEVAFVGGTKFDYTFAAGKITFQNITILGQRTPLTGRYSVTPVATDGTKGVAVTFAITVNPKVTVDKPRDIDVTSGVQVPGFSFSSNVPGLVYEWKLKAGSPAIPNLAAAGDGTAFPAFYAVNNTNAVITATYTVTALAECVDSKEFTITIHPVAKVNAMENQTICSGEKITDIPVVGAAVHHYEFAFVEGKNFALKFNADTTAIISENVLTNSEQAPLTGKYSVTPVAKDGTKGAPVTFTVTVRPKATLVKPKDIRVASGVNVPEFELTSNVFGLNYSWKKISGPELPNLLSAGEGTKFPAFQAVNNANDSIIATYRVKVLSGCADSVDFTITVYPMPIVAAIENQTICSEEKIAKITLDNKGVSFDHYDFAFVEGKNFALTFAKDSIVSATALTNSTQAPLTGKYSVTPVAKDGTKGAPVTFTITVKPAVTLVKPKNIDVTSGVNVPEFELTSNILGLSYSWKKISGDDIQNLPVAGESLKFPAFQAVNNGTAPVTATYEVSVPSGCANTETFTITVRPVAVVSAIENQTICSGTSISTIVLNKGTTVDHFEFAFVEGRNFGLAFNEMTNKITSATITNNEQAPLTGTYSVTPVAKDGTKGVVITFTVTVKPKATLVKPKNIDVTSGVLVPEFELTSNVLGLTYSWRKISGDDIQNLPVAGESLKFPAFQAVNNGTAPVTATYEISVPSGCANTETFTITVRPVAAVNAIENQMICAGTSIAEIALDKGTTVDHFEFAFVEGKNFTLNFDNVTNKITSLALDNKTQAPLTGKYSVTPVAKDGTKGAVVTFTVTVNPNVVVDAPRNIDVTSGVQVPGFSFSSNIPGLVYEWKLANGSDAIPNLSTAGNGTAFPAFQAVNHTGAVITATYNVSALADCVTPASFTVTVRPVAYVDGGYRNQVICNNSEIAEMTLTGNANSYLLKYVGGKDLGLNLTGNVVSSKAVHANTTSAPISGTYQVIPVALDGTQGVAGEFTIVVNPTPTVKDINSQVVCNGSATETVTFSGAVENTTFTWKVNDGTRSNLGLQLLTGTGNFDAHVLRNTTGAPMTDVITVTPRYSINASESYCEGTPKTFSITVNPTPVATEIADKTFNQGENVAAIAFSSNITSGTVTYKWYNNNVAISSNLPAEGTGNALPAFTTQNTSSAPIVSTISVIPTYEANGAKCEGQAMTFTITVNPKPRVEPIIDQIVCNGIMTDVLTPSISAGFGQGSYITWTGGSVIGLADGQGQYIPSFQAINAAQTNDLAVATITVTPWIINNGMAAVGGDAITFTYAVKPSTKFFADQNSKTAAKTIEGCKVNETIVMDESVAYGYNLKYQWYKNDQAIAGANDETYTIAEPTYKDNGTYYVKVKGDCNAELISKPYVVSVSLVDVLAQRWDDVIIVKCNPDENGGFTFTEFEWFLEGSTTPIVGENKSYLQVSGGVNGKTYYARVKTADGIWYATCSYTGKAETTPAITIYPNPVNAGEAVQVKATGLNVTKIQVVNNVGEIVNTVTGEGENTSVVMPSIPSIYIVRTLLSTGDSREFKVIVK